MLVDPCRTCDGAFAAAALGCKEFSKTGHAVGIIIPGGELLPCQGRLASRADQAFSMPGLVTVGHAALRQRLWGQHRSAVGSGDPHPGTEPRSLPTTDRPCPHLAAASTARGKLVLIAGDAVVSTLVRHEGTGAKRLFTAAAQEAMLVPRLASIFQLPGPCGEQGSLSEAGSQAPERCPLLPPRRDPAVPKA